MATESDCAVLTLLDAGDTVTVGVVVGWVTVTVTVPEALL
jgi:hypothetical protein